MITGDLSELLQLVAGNHPPVANLLAEASVSAELANTSRRNVQNDGGFVHGCQR